MRIYVERYVEIPAGFYCERCWRRKETSNKQKDFQYACEEFNCFLKQDNAMKTVKCSECLEAYREALLNK